MIAESELNRAQLAGDLAALTTRVRSLTDRARSFGSIASSAAVLIAGLVAFRRTRLAHTDAKHSWPRPLLQGAGLLSTLWLAFRPRGGDPTDK